MHQDYKKYIQPAFLVGEIGGPTQKAAQKTLYNDLCPHIIRLLKNKGVLNTEDAEDVFHQAILALYENAQKKEFILTTSLQNYVWAIARNIFYKKIATEKRGKDVPIDSDKALNSEESNQWNENDFMEEINPIIKKLDIWQIVKNTIEELGQPCKKLIALRNEGKKFKEIFDLMPELKSADNTKHKTNRCKQALIKKVRNHPYYKTAKNTYYDMENRNLQDLLLKYVDGELKDDELKAFELELKSNKELQEDLEVLQIMESHSQDKGLLTLDENLKEFSSDFKKVKAQKKKVGTETNLSKKSASETSKPKTIPIYRRNWLKIAASFLLFSSVLLVGLRTQLDPEKLFVDNFELYATSQTRSNSKPLRPEIDIMVKGSILLYNNEPEKANKKFDEIFEILELNERIEPQAIWYKALSYLRMKDYSRCRQEIEKIVNNENYSKNIKNKASTLLWKVKILEWWNSMW